MPGHDDDCWSVHCRDGAGRERTLTVFVTTEAAIAVHAPPGEVAVISSNQVGELKDVLSAAQIKAVARRQAR